MLNLTLRAESGSEPLFPAPSTITLPERLLGRSGGLRTTGPNTLGADDDLSAIRAFVVRRASEHTRRTYEREIQRLWYWAMYVRDLPISSLLYEDYLAFRSFLADPQPAEFWIGPPVKRSDPRWRPFIRRRRLKASTKARRDIDGKLDVKSRDLAMTIIKGMLEFWMRSAYIIGNPLADLKREEPTKSAQSKRVHQDKILTTAQWRGVLKSLDAMPKESKRQQAKWHRARYLTHMLFSLGVRISELEFKSPRDKRTATHTQIYLEKRSGWWLTVTGKGNKERDVPIHPELLQIICDYRCFHGLTPFPNDQDEKQSPPLLPPLVFDSTKPLCDQGITARRANKILESIFKAAKDYVPEDEREGLLRFSAHSFRHTSVSRELDVGVAPNLVKLKHGHQSLDTTLLYAHTENQEMASALRRRRMRE